MRLGDLFQLSNKKTAARKDAAVSSSDSSKGNQVNRQIRSLIPGQTIQGEIVSKNGSEVQVRLLDDLMLTARLEMNMNLELGRSMSFTVMNNGSALTLSPLFANMATDANILKAIDMAALPVNHTTVSMTQSLMEAGLPIDKSSLSQALRELTANPEAKLEDVIDLHKLGMKVNGENISQIASYKALTHQLVTGMTNICDELPALLQQMTANGKGEAAMDIFLVIAGQLAEDGITPGLSGNGNLASDMIQDGMFHGILGENRENMIGSASDMLQDLMPGQTGSDGKIIFPDILEEAGLTGEGEGKVLSPEAAAKEWEILSGGKEVPGKAQEPVSVAASQGNLSASAQESISAQGNLIHNISTMSDTLMEILDQAGLPREINQFLRDNMVGFSEGNLNGGQILKLVAQLAQQLQKHSPGSMKSLGEVIGGKAMKDVFTEAIKDSWTIRPQDVRDMDKLDSLFDRMNRQLSRMNQAIEQAGQSGSNAARSITNMTQNLDFLHQMNQMYAYVQLPLKMSQSTAHGELYVYSKKKHLASKDGNISALLHLDMANLGPVDVYVAMEGARVNTHFYVQNEGMLDFMAAHLDILSMRLQEKGYDLHCEMQVKEKLQEESVIQTILGENAPNSPLVQYAFDVRA